MYIYIRLLEQFFFGVEHCQDMHYININRFSFVKENKDKQWSLLDDADGR
jgi:hypothetical protein